MQASHPSVESCDGFARWRILLFVSTASTFAIELPEGLLAGVRRGDSAAFERLFRLFERPVYSLALRMLGDREEAMNVLHDTFLKLAQALSGFRGDSPFWGWLRRIAVNEALMQLRRRGALPHINTLDDVELTDLAAGPLQHAEAAALERAMADLPAVTRSVLWLYHGEGYTHEEIGQLMARTPSFSKSQLARGTQRLRAMLESPTAGSNIHPLERHHVG